MRKLPTHGVCFFFSGRFWVDHALGVIPADSFRFLLSFSGCGCLIWWAGSDIVLFLLTGWEGWRWFLGFTIRS